MSRSTMYFADKTGQLTGAIPFGNAWKFGAFVFNALCEKYKYQIAKEELEPEQKFLGPLADWARLWNMVSRKRNVAILEAFELNTLVTGYDRAYIQGRGDITRCAESYRKFAETFGKARDVPNHESVDSHLPLMAKNLLEVMNDDGAEYVCWYPMDVSDDFWYVRGEDDSGAENHYMNFLNEEDVENVNPIRYIMAPVDGPKVSLGDIVLNDEESDGLESSTES